MKHLSSKRYCSENGHPAQCVRVYPADERYGTCGLCGEQVVKQTFKLVEKGMEYSAWRSGADATTETVVVQ